MKRARQSAMRCASALALLAGVGGCATLTETNQQTLRIQAVQDHREVAGVGCVLSNKVGRWFVMAPGLVTIQKSVGDLWVDCKRDDRVVGFDIVPSKENGSGLWGNLLFTAGLGYLVDRNTGAGFDYPSTLTVILRPGGAPPAAAEAPAAGNRVY